MSDSRKFLYAIAKERKFCYVKLFKKKVVLDFNGCDDTCCCVNCAFVYKYFEDKEYAEKWKDYDECGIQ